MSHGLRRSIVSVAVTAALVLGGLLVSPIAANATDDPGGPTPNVQAQDQAQQKLQALKAADSTTPQVQPLDSGTSYKSFHADEIITDNNFYGGNAMTATAVQSFLAAQYSGCESGLVCLKDYRQTTTTRPADAVCATYTGATNELASAIIAKAGQACGISQKVLLATLQKETSLVTRPDAAPDYYKQAMGYACPDTGSGCDTDYEGFYNQVYWAAWQFKRYSNPAGATGQPFTTHPVGTPSAVLYNPVETCGSSNLTIKSQATAALYYYTPYQPNANALNNTPDNCSTYANANFWANYFDWFGNPITGVAPNGSFDRVTASGGALHVTGWAVDQTSLLPPVPLQIQVTNPSGSTTTVSSSASSSRLDVATLYPLAGPLHGIQTTVPASASGTYTVCVTALSVPGYNATLRTNFGCKSLFYSASTGSSPAVARLSGNDRYSTAVAIANAAYPDHAKVVYIATGENYPDALSAAPAAVAEHGPLLLVPPSGLPDFVADEISDLQPEQIIVVGGPTTVPDAIVTQLTAIAPTIRIAGVDRFATSRLITAHAFKDTVANAFVATGYNFPDALSASAVAAGNGSPVILVPGTYPALDTTTTTFIQNKGITNITIAGDPNAVSTPIMNQLNALPGITVQRLSGIDRYSTSGAINRASFTTATNAYFATGSKFPDALAGAALAGAKHAPLYVVPTDCAPAYDLQDITTLGITNITLLGDANSLTTNVQNLKPC